MKNLLPIILGAFIWVSCQKVIDVELNAAAQKYVIEGGINNISTPQIKITNTKKFSDNNAFESVANAFVTISDNVGNVDTLKHVKDGIYQSGALIGVPGRIYSLIVKIENVSYSSTLQMPSLVNMDSLYFSDFTGFGDTIKMANVQYRDPVGEKNYYRFVATFNKVVHEGITIGDDQLNNGKAVRRPINYRNRDLEPKKGDSLTIEMQCIDKDVYNYFFTLNQTIRQTSAAPTNPNSNITGGALGYFSSYTIQKRSIVFP